MTSVERERERERERETFGIDLINSMADKRPSSLTAQ